MAKYLVTFAAEIYVEIEADSPEDAELVAEDNWTSDDVEIIDTVEVEPIGDE